MSYLLEYQGFHTWVSVECRNYASSTNARAEPFELWVPWGHPET